MDEAVTNPDSQVYDTEVRTLHADSNLTVVEVTVRTSRRVVSATGTARRFTGGLDANGRKIPGDRSNRSIGLELATARAFTKLGHKLERIAQGDINNADHSARRRVERRNEKGVSTRNIRKNFYRDPVDVVNEANGHTKTAGAPASSGPVIYATR